MIKLKRIRFDETGEWSSDNISNEINVLNIDDNFLCINCIIITIIHDFYSNSYLYLCLYLHGK